MEIWKDVTGFEGVYQISSLGKLKSFKDLKFGRILSNKNSKGDYLSVVLEYKGEVRYVRLHRLVAETFIPNPNKFNEINHIDGNKQNNDINNLEWCTKSHNIRHSILMHPNQLIGMNNYNQFIRPNKISQYTLSGDKLNVFDNSAEAEKHTGVCHRNILQVCCKTEFKPGHYRKQAGGYRWGFEFVNRKEAL